MSCPKDTNILTRDEFGNIIAPIVRRISKCKGRKSFYPSFTPIIDSISVNSSIAGVYTVVTIQGSNFLPPCIGETYVNFGTYRQIPIIFYSSFTISFVVPLAAVGGIYNIRVVNIYNDNFSLPVSQSYPGIPNYSNSVPFRVYNIAYTLTGTYTLSSDASYNTIINFNGNGTFNILKNNTNTNINYIAVGGGGGGGGGGYFTFSPGAGGGGGGGVATGFFNQINNYNIIIGAKGNGGTKQTAFLSSTDGTNGGSSQIAGVITVNGGFGGKSEINNGTGGNSGNGGTGGTGTTNPGGNGLNGGGGGGGSYNSPTGSPGGNGAISTTSVYSFGTDFGAGGGGGGGGSTVGTSISGTGGNIYAGNGGNGSTGIVGNATANYGGGGGGGISGLSTATTTNGGDGGSGRVVLYFNN